MIVTPIFQCDFCGEFLEHHSKLATILTYKRIVARETKFMTTEGYETTKKWEHVAAAFQSPAPFNDRNRNKTYHEHHACQQCHEALVGLSVPWDKLPEEGKDSRDHKNLSVSGEVTKELH